LRKEIKAKIAQFNEATLSESNAGILSHISALPEFLAARRVFTYLSIGREPDTRRLIELCLSLKKTVAVPYKYNAGEMQFALLDRPAEALEKGIFGIPVPSDDTVELVPGEGDLLVVPALCCDENGYRLGRGGGYYDRYLTEHTIFSVGLCREALMVEKVPLDVWDKRVSCVITDKRIARPK